jgi:hypothetical protein
MIRVLHGLSVLGTLIGLWLLDVFTWRGLGAAFWPWTDTTGLLWAAGTRTVWWLLVVETCAAVTMRLVWREGRLECPTMVDLWLSAHVSIVQRAKRRIVWQWAGLVNAVEQHKRHRPVVVPAVVSAVSTQPQDRVQDTREAA